MDLRPGRQHLIKALTDSGVEFPESATLTQLRSLYAVAIAGKDDASENDDAASSSNSLKKAAIEEANGTQSGTELFENFSPDAKEPGAITPAATTRDAILSAAMLSNAILADGKTPPTTFRSIMPSISVPSVNLPAATMPPTTVTFSTAPAVKVPSVTVPAATSTVPSAIFAAALMSGVNVPVGNEASTSPLPPTQPTNTCTHFVNKPAGFPTNNVPTENQSLPQVAAGFAEEEQLKRLQLQFEILKLQQQIRALEGGGTMVSTRRIDLMELDAAVPLFSGDDPYDVVKWLTVFDDYTSTCGYSNKEKCVAIRRRLAGTAKQHVMNLGLVGYDELRESLYTVFKRSVTRQEIYRQLRARSLKPNESCLSYLVSMQAIAAQMEIDEQELVDLVIDGIPDRSTDIARLYGARSIKELISRMDSYEQRRQARMGAMKTASYSKEKTVNNNNGMPSEVNVAEIRCYNCSEFGHFQSKCPKPKRPPNSCFICAEVGHFRRDCPKKKGVIAGIRRADAEEDVGAFRMVHLALYLPPLSVT